MKAAVLFCIYSTAVLMGHTVEKLHVSTLKQEVESICLSSSEKLGEEEREFLPHGTKGTSREECLVFHFNTNEKENQILPFIVEFTILGRLNSKYTLISIEKERTAQRVYWILTLSPKTAASSVNKSAERLPDDIVRIWLDVTSSNAAHSVEDRDVALQRSAELLEQITEVFSSVANHTTAEQAAQKLIPIIEALAIEWNIVILGTPEGERLPDPPFDWRFLEQEDRILENNFYNSDNLPKVLEKMPTMSSYRLAPLSSKLKYGLFHVTDEDIFHTKP